MEICLFRDILEICWQADVYFCFSAVNVNESCFFHEQCEGRVMQTECRDGRCICLFEKIPVTQPDGVIICVGKETTEIVEEEDGTRLVALNENSVMPSCSDAVRRENRRKRSGD